MSDPQNMNVDGLDRGVAVLLESVQGNAPLVVQRIPVDAIDPNRAQPRREFREEDLASLAQSIARHGVLQPVLCRPTAIPGRYELIAGERRWRAVQRIGQATIPAVIAEIPDDRLLEVALVENLQRSELNPIEEAEAFRSLIDSYGYTQDVVAERVGKSRSTVANALRLLELPRGVRRIVENGQVSAGHARALCGLKVASEQEALCERIMRDGLSVRGAEAEVQRIKKMRGGRSRRDAAPPPYLGQIETRLRRVLGTKVRLVQTGRQRGRIVIDFHSDDEFERLLEFFS